MTEEGAFIVFHIGKKKLEERGGVCTITALSGVIESVYKYRGWFQCGHVQDVVGVKTWIFWFWGFFCWFFLWL